jgi:CelD/BcsL family acetyltransferase involved in cellulose biosynthesis
MSVTLISDSESLQSLQNDWNALTTSPFHSWDWLATWWKHYGNAGHGIFDRNGGSNGEAAAQLQVLAVYDRDSLIGIAPWYLDRSLVKGSVLRWLGSGEVCTDHLSLICRPENRNRVAAEVAESLTTDCVDWDRLDLSGVDSKDEAIATLLAQLQERECVVSRQIADSCWVLDLPATWDDYLASISKSHRKQLRQLERRVLESGRTEWHRVETADQLEAAWPVLVDLHQRRRISLGEPGCFASQTFHDFHRDVAGRLLSRNQLRVSWLTLDGTPAAAEYHFADSAATYAYQGGVDPDRLQEEPGRLSTILCMQRAIEDGHRHFDFLRGDEPYKAHWRAEPRATFNYSVVPNRRLAKIRGRVLDLTGTMKDWVRSSVQQLAD